MTKSLLLTFFALLLCTLGHSQKYSPAQMEIILTDYIIEGKVIKQSSDTMCGKFLVRRVLRSGVYKDIFANTDTTKIPKVFDINIVGNTSIPSNDSNVIIYGLIASKYDSIVHKRPIDCSERNSAALTNFPAILIKKVLPVYYVYSSSGKIDYANSYTIMSYAVDNEVRRDNAHVKLIRFYSFLHVH